MIRKTSATIITVIITWPKLMMTTTSSLLPHTPRPLPRPSDRHLLQPPITNHRKTADPRDHTTTPTRPLTKTTIPVVDRQHSSLHSPKWPGLRGTPSPLLPLPYSHGGGGGGGGEIFIIIVIINIVIIIVIGSLYHCLCYRHYRQNYCRC